MPYQQVTRLQLRALLSNRLGALAGTFYIADEMNGYLQEALRVWNACTGYWKTRAQITTEVGIFWYQVPTSITSQMRVSFNDNPMTQVSLTDMDNGRPGWEGETTINGGDVPKQPTCYVIAGVNLIAIWPADAAGNNSLVMDGISNTPVLTDDASFVDIGEEDLQHILDYAEVIAKFKEGGSELQNAGSLLQSFLSGAANANAMLMANSKFREAMGMDTGLTANPRELTPARLGAR